MAKRYLRQQDLKNLNYAFFPLHTEPEVTLSVYSKAHLNQIETIRLISHSLPVRDEVGCERTSMGDWKKEPGLL